MASARRKIQMTGQERFRISDTNPNEAIGLPGCLGCGSPYCPGPYMVFPTRVLVPGSRRMAFISISLACAKKAVLNYEAGGDIARIGSGRPEDGDQVRTSVADLERAAELLHRMGVFVDPEGLASVTSPDNPYFHTGVGRDGVPVHRMLDEMRASERGDAAAEIDYNKVDPHVDPLEYDPEKATKIAASEK